MRDVGSIVRSPGFGLPRSGAPGGVLGTSGWRYAMACPALKYRLRPLVTRATTGAGTPVLHSLGAAMRPASLRTGE